MAKDGTMRGGARPGSGPKRKALTEKISAGKTATVIDLPDASELTGVDMPPVKDYMKAKQKSGTDLCAEEIFRETWNWLRKVGCTEYVNTLLINQPMHGNVKHHCRHKKKQKRQHHRHLFQLAQL